MKRTIFNINIPKVGTVTPKDWLRLGVMGLALATLWHRGDQIPVIGTHIHTVKHFIGDVTGMPVDFKG